MSITNVAIFPSGTNPLSAVLEFRLETNELLYADEGKTISKDRALLRAAASRAIKEGYTGFDYNGDSYGLRQTRFNEDGRAIQWGELGYYA